MVRVANREVKFGDHLYHIGIRAWGEIIGKDDGSMVYRIGSGAEKRDFYVTDGGLINGVRVLFWHTPYILDLPTNDVEGYKAAFDYIVKNLKPVGVANDQKAI